MAYADIYSLAGEIIEARGWQQGPYYRDDDGRVCVAGAIRAAGKLSSWNEPMIKDAVIFFSHYVYEHREDRPRREDVFAWNDSPSTHRRGRTAHAQAHR